MKRISGAPRGWLLAVLAAAAVPRLVGLDYGLPQVYNADEPHLVNMAVSFGHSLRPAFFKYPTLWPEVLAAAYGAWFAFWSGFGLLRGPADFAAKFAFDPGGFYLLGRALSAAAQIGGLWLLAAAELRTAPRRWPWAALILAFAPIIVELAHASKPDSLMFLLSCAAYLASLRFQEGGSRRWLVGAGLLAGLAASTQYTAAPVSVAVGAAWLLRRGGPAPFSWLLLAAAAAAGGFFAGTPYALLEPQRFLEGLGDHMDMGRLRPQEWSYVARAVLSNAWWFGGEGSPAGAAALLGLAVGLRRDPRRALALFAPVLAYGVLLSFSFDGTVPRYMIGAYPGLALLAAEGLSFLGDGPAWRRLLLLPLVLAPGAALSWRYDAQILRPDTREQARRWLVDNVPPGTAILLDQPHAGPMAEMSREQCLELAERTARAGSPRARLYRIMAEKHPGGGWRVYRVKRSPRDLFSGPKHVARSQADADFLDVRAGLDTVRAVRIEYVITSSLGADPRRARELATFFAELAAGADLVREFPSGPDGAAGPWLRVYRLRR